MVRSDGDVSCVDPGDTAWVMMATILVLGMIPGLALYESGLGPSKHALSIVVQIVSGVMVFCTRIIFFLTATRFIWS
jgi:ammonia channel protein AmtB